MDTKMYIYGIGNNAKKVIRGGVNAEIYGYIQSSPQRQSFEGKRIYHLADLEDYDVILVASIYTDEILQSLMEYKIDLHKVVFMFPGTRHDLQINVELAKKVLSVSNYTFFCSNHKLYEESFFAEDRVTYNKLNKRKNFEIDENDLYPILTDKYDEMGTVNTYFWQDLWAAKLIYNNRPSMHYDIGSRLDGFIAHILAMEIPLKVIDVRPFPQEIENLETIVDDATEMKQFEDNSIESMSALCSLEHFGLGRYGDEVDPEACFKVFQKIQDKLKSGANLYISVPIGREKVQFNAHRIFYASTIVNEFSRMHLKELSYAHAWKIEKNIDIHKYDDYENEDIYGLFHFVKK